MNTSCQGGEAAMLAPFSARLTAVEYRLRRCLEDVPQTPEDIAPASALAHSAPVATTPWTRVRQLGFLTSAATALLDDIDSVEVAVESPGLAVERSTTEWAVEDESADAATFYAARLAEQYEAVKGHVHEARERLQRYVAHDSAFGFPLSCVGGEARAFTAADALGAGVLVEDNRHPPLRARVPVAQVETLRYEFQPPTSGSRRPSEAPTAQPSPATTSVSAEDAVVEDIKRAVQQMKEGAMHMGELMRGEEAALKTSETLMVSGLNKVQQSSRDVDKLTGGATSRGEPRFLNAVPGGAMVWHHVVLPLWDVAKQALLLSSVIAVTGTALMLIVVASKPERLRLKQ